MKKIILTTYGKIIAWILTILGIYTSCEITGPAEYGTPTADFVVKGQVTDKKTQQPIEGMAVINVAKHWTNGNDTTFTDKNGNYELDYMGIGSGKRDIKVYTSDIDGDKNGKYLSDTIQIKADEFIQVKKGKSWYNGMFEGTADFELTEDNSITDPKEEE